MAATQKSLDALAKYVKDRAKYGIMGTNISIPHLRILEREGYIVRGYCGTIDDFTDKAVDYLKTRDDLAWTN